MKLTPDVLFRLGFRGEGRDITDCPAYRLQIPYQNREFKHGYGYELQMVLNDYPESNPNSGILSLYRPGIIDAHVMTEEPDTDKKKSEKVDVIQWREDGHLGGIKYVTFKEQIFPIAWHVTTVERLNSIYTSLTRNAPLKFIKIKK